MIYTSGSTGRPKGVVVGHGGLTNRLVWMPAEYGLAAADWVAQKAPFGFDVSVWEFFWPLIERAVLVVARPLGHQDPVYLAELMGERAVTTVHFVPSMLEEFLRAGKAAECGSLKRVICSGEALPMGLAERFEQQLPEAGLYNVYGPTEATVNVTACAWDGERGGG